MHPIIFEIGNFKVYSYGLMLALAFLIGGWYFIWAGKQKGIKADFIYELIIYVAIAAIIGGKLAYVLISWGYYAVHPLEIWQFWKPGLSFYGGLILGLGVTIIYIWRKKLPLTKIMDVGAPSIALGYAVARIGCFLNGCCAGHHTTLPWGVDFGDGPRHPTQLYASGASLIIFLILHRQEKSRSFEGYLMLLYIVLYAVYRFIIEFFRESPLVTSWLTLGQLVSIIVGITALSAFLYLRSKKYLPK